MMMRKCNLGILTFSFPSPSLGLISASRFTHNQSLSKQARSQGARGDLPPLRPSFAPPGIGIVNEMHFTSFYFSCHLNCIFVSRRPDVNLTSHSWVAKSCLNQHAPRCRKIIFSLQIKAKVRFIFIRFRNGHFLKKFRKTSIIIEFFCYFLHCWWSLKVEGAWCHWPHGLNSYSFPGNLLSKISYMDMSTFLSCYF